MRKFLYTLGALTLIAIIGGGIGLGVLIYKGHALDVESKAFVDGAVPAIAAAWSKQQFLDRAAPELQGRVKPEELSAVFDRFSRLGSLVEYEGSTGQALLAYFTGSGGTVSASYVAKARCQNGSATLRIGLVKRDGRWMIRDFYVDPAPGGESRRAA